MVVPVVIDAAVDQVDTPVHPVGEIDIMGNGDDGGPFGLHNGLKTFKHLFRRYTVETAGRFISKDQLR